MLPPGRKPGSPRPPGSGRQPGTPNKRTIEVMERLTALGCDPIEGMAKIAMNEDNPPDLRGRMYAELAQYVAPKRKAVEVSGDGGGPVRYEVVTGVPASPEAT